MVEFLPGDIMEKFNVYLTPFHDKFSELLSKPNIDRLQIDNRLANVISSLDSSKAVVSFIDDDNIASYYFAADSDIDYVKVKSNDEFYILNYWCYYFCVLAPIAAASFFFFL